MSTGHERVKPASPEDVADDPGSPPLESASAAASNARRRTSRACEGCRKKKIACNGRQPCSACMLRDRDCVYTALTITGRPSKGAVKLLQRQVERLEAELANVKKQNSFSPLSDTKATFLQHRSLSSGSPPSSAAEQCDPNRTQQKGKERYGPAGLDTFASTRTSSTDEDYMFLAHQVDNKFTLNDAQDHRQFKLHTSFRLEKSRDFQYLGDSGWFMTACRLQEYMGKPEDGPGDNKILKAVMFATESERPPSPVEQHEELVMPTNVNLHWPSREREEQMVNVYFRLVHPMMPILCRETLTLQRKGHARAVFERDPIWLSIMLGIFMMAGGHMPAENDNVRIWWDARLKLGGHHLAHCQSIGGMQNLLLSVAVRPSLYLAIHGAFVPIGMVLRSMQDRGLHRENVVMSTYKDDSYRGILRALWWTAQKIDVERCAQIGRTPAAVSFDVLPPRGQAHSPPLPYFNASLKALRPLVCILDRDYAHDRPTRQQITGEVNAWVAELQEFFPFVSKERDDEKILACAGLWLSANVAVSYAYRPAIMMVFRKIVMGTHTRPKGASPSPEQEEVEAAREFDEARVKVKEAFHQTAVVLRALEQRSTNDICFLSDNTAAATGASMMHACVLYFIESLCGQQDASVLVDLEEVRDVLNTAKCRGVLFDRCRECSNVLVAQVKKRSKSYASQAGAPEGARSRANPPAGPSAYFNVPPAFPSGQQCDPMPSAVKLEDGQQCFSAFSQGNTFSQQRPTYIAGSTVPPLSAGGFDGTAGQSQLDPQAWIQSTTTTIGQPGNPFFVAPSVLMTPAQQGEASPESLMWDNLLQNEMMLLDNFAPPGARKPATDALFTSTSSTLSSGFPHANLQQNFFQAQQATAGGSLQTPSTAYRRPSASQFPSLWLGPILSHELSPP